MQWDTSEWLDQEDWDAAVMLSGKGHNYCQSENTILHSKGVDHQKYSLCENQKLVILVCGKLLIRIFDKMDFLMSLS